MKYTLPITAVLLSGSAIAGSTDLLTILSSNAIFLNREIVYQVKDSQATVTISAGVGEFYDSEYKRIGLAAFNFNKKFNKHELGLISKSVISIASKCFNIDSSRFNSIQSWIVNNSVKEAYMYQTAQIDGAEATFGPLKIYLSKRASGAGGQSVSVTLTRDGVPGETPWTNHCELSG